MYLQLYRRAIKIGRLRPTVPSSLNFLKCAVSVFTVFESKNMSLQSWKFKKIESGTPSPRSGERGNIVIFIMYYYLFVQFMIISNSVQKYKTCKIKVRDYNYTDLVN